jgi:hypothetical protein
MTQHPSAQQSPWMTALEIALAVILPFAGLVIALVLFATKRTREGAYVLVAAVVGAVLRLAIFG